MSALPSPRIGWVLCRENALINHWVPTDRGHALSNTCWCKPFLQTEQNRTVVMHNESPNAAPDCWPYAGELPR